MEQRDYLRLTAGERLEGVYPPLRAFRPIHGTKNSHDRPPSSMTVTANNQRTTPGISSALDVPVTREGKYVKRARILMVYGERGSVAAMACGVSQHCRTDQCGDWGQF